MKVIIATGNSDIDQKINLTNHVLVDSVSDLSELIDLLNYIEVDALIVNRLLDSEGDKLVELAKAAQTRDIKIIMLTDKVDDYQERKLISILANLSVYSFITFENLNGKAINDALEDYPKEFEFSILAESIVIEKSNKNQAIETKLLGTAMISIIATTHGAGCTYHCIAIANYLLNLSNKYNVAIVELNNSGDLKRFENSTLYDEFDKNRLFLFYEQSLANILESAKFDYVILDLGCITHFDKNGDLNLNTIEKPLIDEFKRADLKVIVGQANVWQIHKALFYASSNSDWLGQNSNFYYIFNLCDDAIFNSIKETFGENAFHIEYEPNILTLGENQQKLYSKLLASIIPPDSAYKKRLNTKKLLIDLANYALGAALIIACIIICLKIWGKDILYINNILNKFIKGW